MRNSFKPGMPRPENSGRKPGTPNKKTQELRDLADKLGVNPFEILLHFAKGNWEALGYEGPTVTKVTQGGVVVEDRISPELRSSSAREACKYLFPQLKAVEHSGPNGGPMEVAPAATNQERLELIKLMKASKE
jgi:hypothetical protein